jgi:hypothetical protein
VATVSWRLCFSWRFSFLSARAHARLCSSGKSWSFLFPLHVLQPANTSGFRLPCRCSKFSLTRVSAGFNPREWISCLQATRGSPRFKALYWSHGAKTPSQSLGLAQVACSVLLCWPFFFLLPPTPNFADLHRPVVFSLALKACYESELTCGGMDLVSPLPYCFYCCDVSVCRSALSWVGIVTGKNWYCFWVTGSKDSRIYDSNCSPTLISWTRPSGVRWNDCEDINRFSIWFSSSVSLGSLPVPSCVSVVVPN